MCGCFFGRPSAPVFCEFGIQFDVILGAFGIHKAKKAFGGGEDKRLPKKRSRTMNKSCGTGKSRAARGALKQFHRHPGPQTPSGPTHYEHSTACFGARWRILDRSEVRGGGAPQGIRFVLCLRAHAVWLPECTGGRTRGGIPPPDRDHHGQFSGGG